MLENIHSEEKILRAQGKKLIIEQEHFSKLSKEIENKLLSADQLRQQAIDQKLEKVRKVSDLLEKASQTRNELEKEKESKLLEKLEKISLSNKKKEQIQQETIQRAKDHTEKVFQIVQDLKLKENQELKSKESELENKLKQADANRIQVQQKKVEKAQNSYVRRSSSD